MKTTLFNLNLLFFFFILNILICCICIILVNNTIQSVFFLILVFCNSSGILLMLNCDFLAFLLLIIYVGAVAVLFLFVIMMLKINLTYLLESFYRYLPLGILINFLILIEFFFIYFYNLNSNSFEIFIINLINNKFFLNWFEIYFNIENIKILSNLILDYFWIYLIISSIILMIAMIGCILLTLNKKIIHWKSQIHIDKFNLDLKKKIFLINKIK